TAAKSADTNGNGGGASPTQMAPAQLPPVVAPKPAEPKLAVDYESNDSINLTGHRIGEVLVGWKAATDGQVRKALKRQRKDRRPLGALLVEQGVPSDRVTGAVGWQLGVTPVELDSVEVDW